MVQFRVAPTRKSLEMSQQTRRIHFNAVKFIYEAGSRLDVKSVPVATAALIYHKFFRSCHVKDYEPYTIATACLYLGCKVEESHRRLRDIINVCHRVLHPNEEPLDIGSTYWLLRDTITQCELFIIRVMNFHLSFVHPHKYLLQYLKSLHDWLDPRLVARVPISGTAWAMLRDCYFGDICLKYKAEYTAVAILYFSLQCHGVEVPFTHQAKYQWWQVLSENITINIIRDIISELMDLYDFENTLSCSR